MPGNFFEMCAVPAIIVATADVLSVQIGMTEYPARWHVVLAVVLSLLISAINTAILVFAGVDGLTMLCSATLYLPLTLKGLLFRKYSDGRSIFSLTSIALFIQFEACLSLIWLDANARGPLLFAFISLGTFFYFFKRLYESVNLEADVRMLRSEQQIQENLERERSERQRFILGV